MISFVCLYETNHSIGLILQTDPKTKEWHEVGTTTCGAYKDMTKWENDWEHRILWRLIPSEW